MKAISSDSHVVEGPEVFTGLTDKFGDDAPRIVSKSKEGKGDYIVVPNKGDDGINIGQMALASTRPNKKEPIERRSGHKPPSGKRTDPEILALFQGGYDALCPSLKDGAARGKIQDMDGVEAEILYPGYFEMFKIANTELLITLQKNYNDWLKDHCDASKGRLYGLAALPMQNPAVALDEFKRAIKMGYKGVIIPSNAPEGTRYYDEIYDPIWALAQEAGIPISMHVACFSHAPMWVIQAMQRDRMFIYGNSQSLIQETLIDLMVRGVCKKFPKVKFVLAEFNAGWVGHWLDRIDQSWQREYGLDSTSIKYEDVISDTWKRQFFATIEDDQPALATTDIIGENNLMWGSDYPHTDSTFPCSKEVLNEMFEKYPESIREKVTYSNVKNLYGI